ncbi:MAG: hypothetical protein HY268_15310 [Deltaproteobacteria bacterium]|nr:hypothetical protein [Deltaproteobacteria bacterium]
MAQKITSYDLGSKALVTSGPGRHQGLDTVYYTTGQGDQFGSMHDWQRWQQ